MNIDRKKGEYKGVHRPHGKPVTTYNKMQHKVHNTTHDRMGGRKVRVSPNQAHNLTNGELGKKRKRGATVGATPSAITFTKKRGSIQEEPPLAQNAVPQSVSGVSSRAASVQIEKIKIPIAQARPPTTRQIFENMHLSDATPPSPAVPNVVQSKVEATASRGPHGGVRLPASGPSISESVPKASEAQKRTRSCELSELSVLTKLQPTDSEGPKLPPLIPIEPTPRFSIYSSGSNAVPPKAALSTPTYTAAPVTPTATAHLIPNPLPEAVTKQAVPTVASNVSASALQTPAPTVSNFTATPTTAPAANVPPAQQRTNGIQSTSIGTLAPPVSMTSTSAASPDRIIISPAQAALLCGSVETRKTMAESPQKRIPVTAGGVAKFPVALVPVQRSYHPSPGPSTSRPVQRIQPPPRYDPTTSIAKELQRKVPSSSASSATTTSPEPAQPKDPDGGINAIDLLGPDIEGNADAVDERRATQAKCALYEAKRLPSTGYPTYNDFIAAKRESANIPPTPIELPTRIVKLDPNHREKQLSCLNKNIPRPTTSAEDSVPPPRKTLMTIVKDRCAQRASNEKDSIKKRAAEYSKFVAHRNAEERKDYDETMELSSDQVYKVIQKEVSEIRRYAKKSSQSAPLPGPKDPEVYKPPKEWDKKYIRSRLPTANDVLKERRFLKGTSTLRVALKVAQRKAIRALKYEQIKRAYQDYLETIGADVRGPGDPPRDTQCPRCTGIWLKVVELNKDWKKDGNRSVKKCLWCNDACCHLILQKDVELEVGKMYGVPKLEELKFGRSRVEIDSKGKPSKRVLQYLKDLELHRRLARQNGVDLTHKDGFYYTVCAGQKRAVRIV